MNDINQQLLERLKFAATWMENQLKYIGGCDHSVGICCCADYHELEHIRRVISAAEQEVPHDL